LQRVYFLWRQQWTVTAAKQRPNGGNCYCSTQQLQQHPVSKRLPTTDHPRNAARNGVKVWARLLCCVATTSTALYARRRAQRIC